MFKSFLAGLTIGGVGTLVAMQYHLVQTNERFVIVPRAHQPPMRSVYVDIRHWNPTMWDHYPELREAVVKAGREDLMVPQPVEEKPEEPLNFRPTHHVSERKITPLQTPIATPRTVLNEVIPEKTPIKTSPLVTIQGLTAIPESPAIPNNGTSNLSIATRFPKQDKPAEERPVPNPQEDLPPVGSLENVTKSIEKELQSAAPSSNSSGKSWVQSLLKSFVPAGKPGNESKQNTKEIESIQSAIDSLPIEKLEKEIPADILPDLNSIPFPASPRRIPTPGSKAI